MAQSLATLRNNNLTSIYGRRVGLSFDECLAGVKDIKRPTQSLTSGTSATAVPSYGMTALDVTTAAASTASSVGTTEVGCSWVMDPPIEGVQKIVYKVSATGGSTMPVVLEFGSGVTAYNTSLGSTFTGLTLFGVGQYAVLTGVSSAKWLVTAAGTGTSFASSN